MGISALRGLAPVHASWVTNNRSDGRESNLRMPPQDHPLLFCALPLQHATRFCCGFADTALIAQCISISVGDGHVVSVRDRSVTNVEATLTRPICACTTRIAFPHHFRSIHTTVRTLSVLRRSITSVQPVGSHITTDVV